MTRAAEDDEREEVERVLDFTVLLRTEVEDDARRPFLTGLTSLLALAMLSSESLRALSPQRFCSKSTISFSIRFCSLERAESVGQY